MNVSAPNAIVQWKLQLGKQQNKHTSAVEPAEPGAAARHRKSGNLPLRLRFERAGSCNGSHGGGHFRKQLDFDVVSDNLHVRGGLCGRRNAVCYSIICRRCA